MTTWCGDPDRSKVDQGPLRARLRATRFAPDPDNEDEKYGLSTAYLRGLVEQWAEFDLRRPGRRPDHPPAPDAVAGLHLGMPAPLPAFQGDRYWDITDGAPVPEDASSELRHDLSMFVETLASHGAVHTLRRADPHPRAQRLAGRHARLNPQAVEELE